LLTFSVSASVRNENKTWKKKGKKNLISFIVKHFFYFYVLDFFSFHSLFRKLQWLWCKFLAEWISLFIGKCVSDQAIVCWLLDTTRMIKFEAFPQQRFQTEHLLLLKMKKTFSFFYFAMNVFFVYLFVCLLVCLLAFATALSNTMSPNDDDPFLTLSVFVQHFFFCCCQSQFLPASLAIILMYDYFYFSLVPLTFQQDIMSSKLPLSPSVSLSPQTHSLFLPLFPQFLCLSFCILICNFLFLTIFHIVWLLGLSICCFLSMFSIFVFLFLLISVFLVFLSFLNILLTFVRCVSEIRREGVKSNWGGKTKAGKSSLKASK